LFGRVDPFAEADEDTGETKQSQNYIHIRIQRRFYLFASFVLMHGSLLNRPGFR
jgi:hypothetical protein